MPVRNSWFLPLASAAFASAFATMVCAQEKVTVPEGELIYPGRLLVCADVPVPPYITMDADGTPDGIDYALASEIGKRLDLKVQIVNTVFDTIIAALKGRKCDVIMGAMNITDTRQKVITQVPYAQDGQNFAVKKGNPANIQTKLDLCGKRVATQTSTVGTDAIVGSGDFAGKGLDQACEAANKSKIQMLQYAQGPQVLMAVVSGQADASLIDSSITSMFIREHPTALESSPIGPQTPTPQGIGVTFDRPALAKAVQATLADIVADGTYEKIFEKYGYTDGEYLKRK